MNYFAHAYTLLDRDRYFVAGTAMPDWLTVVDRRVRVRLRHVEPALADADPLVANLAAGIRQHLRDDARFHETPVFADTMYRLTIQFRDALGGEAGFRPSFLGHLLTEVLLDAELAVRWPQRLAQYYVLLESVDPALLEQMVNRLAPRPAERLGWFVSRFCQERILYDYADDAKLMGRLNQVMHRVGCAPLPPGFASLLGPARTLVSARADDLLANLPAE